MAPLRGQQALPIPAAAGRVLTSRAWDRSGMFGHRAFLSRLVEGTDEARGRQRRMARLINYFEPSAVSKYRRAPVPHPRDQYSMVEGLHFLQLLDRKYAKMQYYGGYRNNNSQDFWEKLSWLVDMGACTDASISLPIFLYYHEVQSALPFVSHTALRSGLHSMLMSI
ncbi:hypothetical protein BDV33DRAFT_200849 [Aspergillus novoparasiticus]|uniref:Uncharacterized protein n=1 Tax=Aspergillus novoparasiticus TaxID=986946 RepID=A0A5N6F2L6_9EURO|nr:hypothetical protein BDV33DRAFT_200849 [Aspergillus novoparasiticus]